MNRAVSSAGRAEPTLADSTGRRPAKGIHSPTSLQIRAADVDLANCGTIRFSRIPRFKVQLMRVFSKFGFSLSLLIRCKGHNSNTNQQPQGKDPRQYIKQAGIVAISPRNAGPPANEKQVD